MTTSSAPSVKIALVIIYNHRYDHNIDRLEAIYADRFTNIFHVMPFYDGNKENVIEVYENSHQFQGYFTQSLSKVFDPNFTHYIYSADDLILNPKINEHNILEMMGLGSDQAFIKCLTPISDVGFRWSHLAVTLRALFSSSGVEPYPELDSESEAHAKIAGHGLTVGAIGVKNLFPMERSHIRSIISGLALLVRMRIVCLIKRRPYRLLKYPFLLSYSDFLIVPGISIKRFCRLCGIFAAMRIFVELAAPTALALSCTSILQEAQSKMHGREIWEANEVAELENKCHRDLSELRDLFEDDLLYIHPIKLSRWKGDFTKQ